MSKKLARDKLGDVRDRLAEEDGFVGGLLIGIIVGVILVIYLIFKLIF